MTIEQWRLLRPGDVVLDGAHGHARRKIFSITRVSGTRGQGLKTRVCLTCTNLKQSNAKTHIFVSDELGSRRFHFPEASP